MPVVTEGKGEGVGDPGTRRGEVWIGVHVCPSTSKVNFGKLSSTRIEYTVTKSKQESRAAARKPRDAASVLFR